jgi:hypothetical protein
MPKLISEVPAVMVSRHDRDEFGAEQAGDRAVDSDQLRGVCGGVSWHCELNLNENDLHLHSH